MVLLVFGGFVFLIFWIFLVVLVVFGWGLPVVFVLRWWWWRRWLLLLGLGGGLDLGPGGDHQPHRQLEILGLHLVAALQGRLVKAVHKPDELLPAAMAAAREIAANTSAISVTLTRHMMWRLLGADHPMAAHKLDSRGVQFTGKSPDAREGVTSFLEKRAPKFPGKVTKDMPGFFPWWNNPTFE